MDSVLIFFQRKLPKVVLDTTKVFLEPNWKESLKVNLLHATATHHNNGKINIYLSDNFILF